MTEKKKTTKKETKKQENGFFITRTARKAVDAAKDNLNTYGDKFVKPVLDSGKQFRDRVKTDARKAVDSAVEKGKKMVPEIPGAKMVERKFNDGLGAVTGYLNLPQKTDIEKLTAALETLSRKMDALSGDQAAKSNNA